MKILVIIIWKRQNSFSQSHVQLQGSHQILSFCFSLSVRVENSNRKKKQASSLTHRFWTPEKKSWEFLKIDYFAWFWIRPKSRGLVVKFPLSACSIVFLSKKSRGHRGKVVVFEFKMRSKILENFHKISNLSYIWSWPKFV